jgi:hypothetical protein
MADDTGFLSRWSRRKVAVRQGQALDEASAPPPEAVVPTAAAPEPEPAPASTTPPAAPALPTLDDVAGLTRDSDYTAFVSREVPSDVKNAALKKLFADPHFNVMDGLDTYIDDYNKPDPLPPGMLRQMVQSRLLGLFDDEPETQPLAAPAPPPASAEAAPPLPTPALPHEDADMQLQPDPATGRAGAEVRPGEDPGGGPAGQH